MMDLRIQTSLLAGILAIAITATVLLRPSRRRIHWQFGLFGLTVAAWYLTTFLAAALSNTTFWARLNHVAAVLLPLAALRFFRTFVEEEPRRLLMLRRIAGGLGLCLIAVALTPFYNHPIVSGILFVYVATLFVAGLWMIYTRSAGLTSRFEQARLRYLVWVGALAATFTIIDYLSYVVLKIPPVGTVLALIFLYVLSQAILHFRLLDMYELAARLTILTALAFTIAGIYAVLLIYAGEMFFVHAVVASLALLLVFDPARAKLEEKFLQFLFRERYDLEQTLLELRLQLVHILELKAVVDALLAGLERSRRFTHACVYLTSEDMHSFNLSGYFGPAPVEHIEMAPARPLLDRYEQTDVLVIEALDLEIEDYRTRRDNRALETVQEVVQTLDAMNASVCFALRNQQEMFGFLCVRDERVRDAFSPEEIQLLGGLAAQLVIATENSRLYQHMKERDRLAALGEMAAGLAHEIRNPLGAIKASAQYLSEPEAESVQNTSREFLDIIVDETDRLNRVLSSFLDFARPSQGMPEPTDVNAAVRRTLQVLNTEYAHDEGILQKLNLADDLPQVRVDIEQLRQVLINLIRNAFQAMAGMGELTIATKLIHRRHVDGEAKPWVEIRVSDTGPGIPRRVLSNLFVPFVTTREQGTGLGLAISHRIITASGGHIEVRTQDGAGTTFLIRLPVAEKTTSIQPPGLGADVPTNTALSR